MNVHLLTLNSWAHLHPHSWIPGEGGGVKKIRIFCNVRFAWRHQQDLSLWANNNMRRSYALLVDNINLWITWKSCQGHIKVISRAKPQKYWKYTLFINFKLFSGAVIHWRGLMVTHTWSGIISAHIFRKSRAMLILWGVMPPCLPLLHPHSSRVNWISKITIMQQRVASTLAPVAKDWYIIGYGGWHWLRVCFTAWMPPKLSLCLGHVKCQVYQFMGDVN